MALDIDRTSSVAISACKRLEPVLVGRESRILVCHRSNRAKDGRSLQGPVSRETWWRAPVECLLGALTLLAIHV